MKSLSSRTDTDFDGWKTPKNNKNSRNSRKGNSFELLDESDGDDSITVQTTSTRGRPLKRTQPFEPNSPPPAKRANSTKTTASQRASQFSQSWYSP